eukprot:m.43558 g.43558  ORF g.43558 m.43558 type:complete len:51 (-) comp12047_c0_seq1:696-848(-)
MCMSSSVHQEYMYAEVGLEWVASQQQAPCLVAKKHVARMDQDTIFDQPMY